MTTSYQHCYIQYMGELCCYWEPFNTMWQLWTGYVGFNIDLLNIYMYPKCVKEVNWLVPESITKLQTNAETQIRSNNGNKTRPGAILQMASLIILHTHMYYTLYTAAVLYQDFVRSGFSCPTIANSSVVQRYREKLDVSHNLTKTFNNIYEQGKDNTVL